MKKVLFSICMGSLALAITAWGQRRTSVMQYRGKVLGQNVAHQLMQQYFTAAR
jgi:hypothetical protein